MMVDFPTITDRNVPNPNRFIMTNVATGEDTVIDITPNGGVGTEGTVLNKAIFDQLKGYIDGFGATDSVVISSVSANKNPNTDWVWEKLSNGRTTAWRRVTFASVAITTAQTSGYTSSWLALPTLPTGLFASGTNPPVVTVSPTLYLANGQYNVLAWYRSSGVGALATGFVRAECPNSMTSGVTLYANMYVTGIAAA